MTYQDFLVDLVKPCNSKVCGINLRYAFSFQGTTIFFNVEVFVDFQSLTPVTHGVYYIFAKWAYISRDFVELTSKIK